jgi:N-acetylglucosamine-6-phosphate deacetylase
MYIDGRRYDTGKAVRLEIDQAQILASAPTEERADLPWIAPGLIDLQVNGYGGQEFNDLTLTIDQVEKVCAEMDVVGVTGFCPTATTHSFEMLSNTMRILAEACRESESVAARVIGIHLEGPYISAQNGPRGAHPLEHCRPPDWDEFRRLQEAAEGRIRILTLSPEYDGSVAFIEQVVATGVLVAIGHTAADSEQIAAAVTAGARMSTHLGNGAHGQIRRHPNYIWDQLADDRMVASLIVDGFHLPPSVVKSFVRAKTESRCILVSDIVGMAGMPPGQYTNTSVGNIEILEDGRLVVAEQRQYLAGAGLPMTFGIANVMRFAEVSLQSAIEMASIRAAALIGAAAGGLDPGSRPDLVLFDLPTDQCSPLTVRATVNAGNVVYGAV